MSDAITVLGAGAVGVSSAIHLQRRGWRVTLVDRGEPGGGTTHGNAGVINPGSIVPLNSPDLHRVLAGLLGNRHAALRYDRRHVLAELPWALAYLRASKTRAATETARALATLTRDVLEEHRALMQRTGNLHRLTEVGWLKAYRRSRDPGHTSFEERLLAECGIATVRHDAASLAELEPALKPIFVAATELPGGGLVDRPGELFAEHAARFVADGGTLERREVTGVEATETGLRLCTDGPGLACGRLVIAAGPWSGELLASVGYEVPLGVERGYHAHYEPTGEHRLGRSVHDVDASYVVGPMGGALRVTTGVELAPRDAPSNLAQLEQVEPRVREAIDIGERTPERVWRGARPTLPDSRPAIGAVPGRDDLWVNFGHQHIGMMSGPVSGKLLAQLVSGETPDIDMKPFSPGRWVRRAPRRRRRRRER